MSNVGRWDWYYQDRPASPFGYSKSPVFAMAAEWMADCATIADWGCGGGLLRQHVPADRYVGVDGSQTWAVDVIADLVDYHEPSDGVFMRNVLEHNDDWETVLANALSAFRQRMALSIFTPWHTGKKEAHRLQFEDRYEVPTFAFRRDAIESRLDGLRFELHEVPAKSVYRTDHLFLIER